MRYKTCVSVAEETPKRLASTLKRALAESEYAELRLDFLKPSMVGNALGLVRKNLNRTVCTLRPKSEGGRFSGTEKERASILKLIAEYNPYMMDIEYETMRKNRSLNRYIKKTGTSVLISWHDFKGTPRADALAERLDKMSRISRNVKIVTTAKEPGDVAHILSLYHRARNTSLVAFAMGHPGQISRILCLYLGSPFTYVSLGKAVAPGQMSLKHIKRVI